MAGDGLDLVARTLACPIGLGILLNGIEDLAFDLTYFARGLHVRKRRRISADELRGGCDRTIAIAVPAWHEADVIERMLAHNLATLDYDPARYEVFCGTYPNDPETQRRVDAVALRVRNLRKVVLPRPGPTSKADCLNGIYREVRETERRRGRRFDILLLHDAEDVVHPLALRLYARLIPPYDFVQTPVLSLPLPVRTLIGGTYIDEFAEHHLKEMLVRDAIGGFVPSAGVGSAFACEALDRLAAARGGRPFDPDSLAEDYDVALRLRLAGKRTHFACRTIEAGVGRPQAGRCARPFIDEELIATREYFPDRLRPSVRQRSRWIAGITLQTWSALGWRGPAAVLYCLWRDRKGLVTNPLLLVAYLLCAYTAARAGFALAAGHTWSLDAIVPPGSFLAWLLTANLAMLGWRAAMKFWTVGALYGLVHAAVSGPRLVLANFIGLLATGRAVACYAHHRLTGKALLWAKTSHAFPAAPGGSVSLATTRGERAIDSIDRVAS